MKKQALIIITMLLAGCYGPSELFSEMAMKSECKKDGGVKIFSPINLNGKEVPPTYPKLVNVANQRREGEINQDFKYVQTYTYWSSHGHVIYRDVDSIVTKDGNTVAQNIVYIRQGQPELPGTICPENENYYRPDQFYNLVFKNEKKSEK